MESTHALLELIALAIPQLTDVKNLTRRAELLEAAADACAAASCLERAENLRFTASELRRADQAQLALNEAFTNHRD